MGYLNTNKLRSLTAEQWSVCREVARGVRSWAAEQDERTAHGALLLALLQTAESESGLRPGAVGDAGASIGLWQWNFGSPTALGSQAVAAGATREILVDPHDSTVIILRMATRSYPELAAATWDGTPDELVRWWTLNIERPLRPTEAAAVRSRMLRENWVSRPDFADYRGYDLDAIG